MVNAIRYWLVASQMIDEVSGKPSQIGNLIFGKEGWDPYLEDEATIWLIHWLLASNPEKATSIYWFFNRFHKIAFSGQEVQTALHDFVKEQLDTKNSVSTVKADAQLVLRMYSPSKAVGKLPLEDALDSPLSLLRLIQQGSTAKTYTSKPEARTHLPIGILGFAVAELLKAKKLTSIPIEDLMYAKDDFPAPGAVFRLTENDLVTKLELLVHYIPEQFSIRETAGIHQLYQVNDKLDSFKYLRKHYTESIKGIAA